MADENNTNTNTKPANAPKIMLKINNNEVPQPSKMTYDRIDYDSEDSFRTMSGTMVRDRITTKVKLNCEWYYLTIEEAKTLLNAVKDVSFTVQYYDPFTWVRDGQFETATMYVGDRSLPFYNVIDNQISFVNITMNFIEY